MDAGSHRRKAGDDGDSDRHAPAGDPVGTGLISSLVRPGGNITDLSSASAETGAKTLELIREVLPSARRVAVLADAPNPFSRDWYWPRPVPKGFG